MRPGPRVWHWGEALAPLIDCLDRGGMLAIPTESSYGLGVDPRSVEGVATLFRCKGRAADKALPVVLGDLEQLSLLGGDAESVDLLALASLWPAPLTVVIPISDPIPASCGRRDLAIRIPAHDRLRDLLRDLGRPLTATSANPSGQLPVSSSDRLLEMLEGWPSLVVDDGELTGGPASTIVQIEERGYRVLRVGALSPEWLRGHLSRPVFSADLAEISADDPRHAP